MTDTPWLDVSEAAQRARCGKKTIWREARGKRLRCAKVGGRRKMLFLADWIDEWLIATSEPVTQFGRRQACERA